MTGAPEPLFGHECCCEDYLDHLAEYLDGELTAHDVEALKAHLESCPPCLTAYQRDALLKALVQRSCRGEHAPTELRASIMRRISVQIVTIEHREF